MVASFVIFAVALILRILFGYLATVYDYMTEWVPWFSYLTIAVAVIVVVFVIITAIKSLRKKN